MTGVGVTQDIPDSGYGPRPEGVEKKHKAAPLGDRDKGRI